MFFKEREYICIGLLGMCCSPILPFPQTLLYHTQLFPTKNIISTNSIEPSHAPLLEMI